MFNKIRKGLITLLAGNEPMVLNMKINHCKVQSLNDELLISSDMQSKTKCSFVKCLF